MCQFICYLTGAIWAVVIDDQHMNGWQRQR